MTWWPLADLRLHRGDLELRLPSPEQLAALGDLAAEGVHPPERMPFLVPWTDAEPAERARGTLQWHWQSWASLRPEQWRLGLVVLRHGDVVGIQEVAARDFGVSREVTTGSWLGARFQGQGVGTAMRAAVLDLAFAGLGAQTATSGAFVDNAASLGVSRRLGYLPDGEEVVARRGQRAVEQRLRITSASWQAHDLAGQTEIENLAACRALLGLAD